MKIEITNGYIEISRKSLMDTISSITVTLSENRADITIYGDKDGRNSIRNVTINRDKLQIVGTLTMGRHYHNDVYYNWERIENNKVVQYINLYLTPPPVVSFNGKPSITI